MESKESPPLSFIVRNSSRSATADSACLAAALASYADMGASMQQRISTLFVAVVGAALFALSGGVGCSAADSAQNCTSTAECSAGLACAPNGECGIVPCDDGCIEGESCLRVNDMGQYDPNVTGVCTSTECSSGRGGESCPPGEQCLDGVCYANGGGTSCTCSNDCRTGQACIGGTCQAPRASCSGDCECPVGQTCAGGTCQAAGELCGGVACDSGEACVENVCVAQPEGCDPACGPGEVCDAATGTCSAGSSGNLCDACTSDDECGGESDACVSVGGNSVCGQTCAGASDCPDGYTCFRVDSVVGMQCVPGGGSCEGCLSTGCSAGQFCNPGTFECSPLTATCDPCGADVQCGSEARCAQIGGASVCLDTCTVGADNCAPGHGCQDVRGTALCVPDGGSCSGPCDATCAEPTPVVNSATCTCVECVTESDCGTGELCSPGGTCIFGGGDPCTSIADCPPGQICDTRINRCVQCITAGDCATGLICVSGQCRECVCPPGQRCTLTGECQEVDDPGSCTSDSQCAGIARDLGGTGEGAACDSTIGCYTAGTCNGSLLGGGGGFPIDIPDFGDASEDPFNAPCPPGTSCDIDFDLLGAFTGGDLLQQNCQGCIEGDPSSCREGETCSRPLFALTGDTPRCTADSGGGFPFPFPF